MSDQTPNQNVSVYHASFSLATCQITINQKYLPLPDGRSDDVNLVDIDPMTGTGEPIGFARFSAVGGGPISISGMVPNNAFFPGHGILLLVRNDSAIDLTFLNQSAFSRAPNRFILGADFTLATQQIAQFIYLPDYERWGLFSHSS